MTSTDSVLDRLTVQSKAGSCGQRSVRNNASDDESGVMIRLYLRPGFITGGLDGILNSPGRAVKLKYVEVLYMEGACTANNRSPYIFSSFTLRNYSTGVLKLEYSNFN